MDEATENLLKKCNSANEIRAAANQNPHHREKWVEKVKPLREQVASRFQRVKLKEEPVTVIESATDEDMDLLK